jgi:hypothetical protein
MSNILKTLKIGPIKAQRGHSLIESLAESGFFCLTDSSIARENQRKGTENFVAVHILRTIRKQGTATKLEHSSHRLATIALMIVKALPIMTRTHRAMQFRVTSVINANYYVLINHHGAVHELTSFI